MSTDLYQAHIDRQMKSSMLTWWPLVEHLDVPSPRTCLIDCRYHADDFWQALDGKPLPDILAEQLENLCQTSIGYPAFLRTDLTSGKHLFTETCIIDNFSDVDNPYYPLHRIKYFNYKIFNLIEANVNGPGLVPTAFAIRQFLTLEAPFKAFFGLPIARERRYFINNGEVQCWHPYWPEDAIQFNLLNPPDNWQDLLKTINTYQVDETILVTYAERLGKVLNDYWSVDFAYTRDKQWYFIDAAQGIDSWHDPSCIYAAR